ncbi:Clr5 domain-containing protein [Xylariales sp. AK1849]|nr:Clr5 domain-containing protein [Xylariales sp. AK1849]
MSEPAIRWASLEAWEVHRETITELYGAQNLKLQDVMKIMEAQHQFFATARMYKARFNKWGLQKTLRFQDVGELLRQNTHRATGGKPSIHLIRGKKVDDKRLKKYLRSLSAEKHRELSKIAAGTLEHTKPPPSFVVSCRTPSPGPPVSYLFHIPSPEHLRIPEETIYAMRQYVGGALSIGLWALDPADVVRAGPLFTFWNYARTGKRLLQAGQTKQAFRVLQNCFHEYKALLAAQSPILFIYTYVVSLIFADDYPELYVSFIKYTTAMARIVHQDSHPLHALLGNLQRMGPSGAKQNVESLTQSYMDICQRTPSSIAMIDVEGFVSMNLAELGLQGYDAAEATLRDMLVRLEPYRGSDIVEAICLDCKDDMSTTCMRQGKNVEARQILMESLESPVLPRYPLLHASVYRNLFALARDSGTHEETLIAGQKVLKFCKDAWGLGDNRTITVLTDVKFYLRSVGDNDTADLIDQNFDAGMDELSKDIGEIDLNL